MKPHTTPPAALKRKRNALVTRAAILQAGLRAFCAHGYDGIGVRDIAASAGITPVLVNRYFGSKEELFAAAVESAFSGDNPFKGDIATLASRFSTAMVAKTDSGADDDDALLLLLRSAANPRAADILKASIARNFAAPLETALDGEQAALRASLFLAQIAGFQLMRKIIQLDPLVDCDAGVLAKRLEAMLMGQLCPVVDSV